MFKIGWKSTALLIVVGYFVYTQSKTKVIQSVNPVNPDNIFNQGAISAFKAITGSNQQPAEAVYDTVQSSVKVTNDAVNNVKSYWTAVFNSWGWR